MLHFRRRRGRQSLRPSCLRRFHQSPHHPRSFRPQSVYPYVSSRKYDDDDNVEFAPRLLDQLKIKASIASRPAPKTSSISVFSAMRQTYSLVTPFGFREKRARVVPGTDFGQHWAAQWVARPILFWVYRHQCVCLKGRSHPFQYVVTTITKDILTVVTVPVESLS